MLLQSTVKLLFSQSGRPHCETCGVTFSTNISYDSHIARCKIESFVRGRDQQQYSATTMEQEQIRDLRGQGRGLCGPEHSLRGQEYGLCGQERGLYGQEHGFCGQKHGHYVKEYGHRDQEHGLCGQEYSPHGQEHGHHGQGYGLQYPAQGSAEISYTSCDAESSNRWYDTTTSMEQEQECGLYGQEHGFRTEKHGLRGQELGIRGQECGLHGHQSQEHGFRSQEHGLRGQEHGCRSQECGFRGQERGLWGQEHGSRSKERGVCGLRGQENGLPYTAQSDTEMSEYPVQNAELQGILGSMPSLEQRLLQLATGESTTTKPVMEAAPLGIIPVAVGPPSLIPVGMTNKTVRKLAKRQEAGKAPLGQGHGLHVPEHSFHGHEPGLQYPAQGNAEMSEYSVQNAEMRSVLGSTPTPEQRLLQWATGESMGTKPLTEIIPLGIIPAAMGPPPSIPVGLPEKELRKWAKREARRARFEAEAQYEKALLRAAKQQAYKARLEAQRVVESQARKATATCLKTNTQSWIDGFMAKSQSLCNADSSLQSTVDIQGAANAADVEMFGKPLSSLSERPIINYVADGTSEKGGLLLTAPLQHAVPEIEPVASTSAEGATGQVTETVTGCKRKAEAAPTPSQVKRKKVRKTKRHKRCAALEQAERDNFLGVVVVRGDPYTVLSEHQLSHVRSELVKRKNATTSSGSVEVPVFRESGLHHGRLHLSCANSYSYQWLYKEVYAITASQDKGQMNMCRLQLVSPSDVPELFRAGVIVSGPAPAVPKFVELLRGQNVGLRTGRWLLQNRTDTNRCTTMIWMIDKDSANALKAVDNKPYYGFGQLTFNVCREQIQAGDHNGTSTMSVGSRTSTATLADRSSGTLVKHRSSGNTNSKSSPTKVTISVYCICSITGIFSRIC